jgi:hypothetical protein
MRLKSIQIVVTVDDCPDFSHLGEYTDTPSDWVIVRRDGDYLANLEARDPDHAIPRRGRESRSHSRLRDRRAESREYDRG